MKTYIKRIILTGLVLASLSGSPLFSATVSAQAATPPPTSGGTPASAACDGIKAAGGSCDTATGQDGFNKIMIVIINTLSIVVGAVCVVMIIFGGFRYVVSAGDSNALGAAKNTIIYAIVGLVIVLFAQVIVQFVFVKATESATPTGGACDPADPTCVTPPTTPPPTTPPPTTPPPTTPPPEANPEPTPGPTR